MKTHTPTRIFPRQRSRLAGQALVLLFAGLLAASSAMAEKPDGPGGKDGKHGQAEKLEKQERKEDKKYEKEVRKDEKKYDKEARKYDKQGPRVVEVRQGGYFHDEQRTVVRTYYVEQFRVGRCPPGLARKHDGCVPPGHARKWAMGRPLPRDVVYYSVPPAVIVQLGAPPAGYRYVRVSTDILLITLGTAMVVDAIQDLDRM